MPPVSIIIPSFQQKEYLRACLHSVLAAGDAEIIVVDGGSTDGSVDVIREFESQLAWWVSEPDEGQTDAINKGLQHSTGGIWAYVNSDDLLEPDALSHVIRFFEQYPNAKWLSGGCRVFGEDVEDWFLNPAGVSSRREVLTPWDRSEKFVFPQSGACFMHRSVLDEIGSFDASYHYSMDIEYYTRAAIKGGITQHITDKCLAAWRWHPDAKSFQKGIAYAFREDEIRIAEEYLKYLDSSDQHFVKSSLKSQKQQLFVRKAMWALRNGDRLTARKFLLQALGSYPSSILNRAWLGAVRRSLTAEMTTR